MGVGPICVGVEQLALCWSSGVEAVKVGGVGVAAVGFSWHWSGIRLDRLPPLELSSLLLLALKRDAIGFASVEAIGFWKCLPSRHCWLMLALELKQSVFTNQLLCVGDVGSYRCSGKCFPLVLDDGAGGCRWSCRC